MGVQAVASAATQPIRVALVDDHRLVLDGLTARLSLPAHDIDVVAAETDWHSMLAHPGFPFDVVVLDLHLRDNVPIGIKLRSLVSSGTTAVVMSGHGDNASVSAAVNAGALGFVLKTESADELISAIHAAAGSRPHLSGRAAAAVASHRAAPDAGLGRQELRALRLFAGGRTIREVSTEMGTTEETVKSYLKRGRRKYRLVGIDVGTRVLLRRHAMREGWIRPE